jgi:hypothetical protein
MLCTRSGMLRKLLNRALRITDRPLRVGDCLLGYGDRRLLSAKYVRPKPSINGLLIRLPWVLAQPEAGMKEGPIAAIRCVEILEHTQPGRSTVKTCQLRFTSAQVGFDFGCCFAIQVSGFTRAADCDWTAICGNGMARRWRPSLWANTESSQIASPIASTAGSGSL